ncbi:ATP-dependent DNA ligase [Streptomyces fagopyri]|uniref:ATP-dependent DNA ligase n=1 Tax=Streptomyces fagopyri TaxID=2662397 RepID=UPI001D1770B5|nr:hypothetical protein [Streptomyces fagopyri]
MQNRLQRRGATAARATDEWPAYFIAFDLLRLPGTDTTGWPYRRRRAALESMFAARRLAASWTLPPSTTNPDTVREWLTWTSAGFEGVVFKRLDAPYRPAETGWLKYMVRESTEAVVGAVTGPPATPRSLPLGRYDDHGQLQYIVRTTTLPRTAGAAVSEHLTAAQREHPWTGWSFTSGWGRRETLNVTLVEPDLIVEVGTDIAHSEPAVVPGHCAVPARCAATLRTSGAGRRPARAAPWFRTCPRYALVRDPAQPV